MSGACASCALNNLGALSTLCVGTAGCCTNCRSHCGLLGKLVTAVPFALNINVFRQLVVP